ncbi:hypothetical protein SAMD00019534_110270 [Acytostelium subglobosum LB1]|uniref:hypothetical protein n=1 Tax=Acytostelium subglobosum LB1 TaxID=1410327 RepID=UPI000644B6BD|nr:hypothetical protein SAMD00019534_110270 [Acytostelium subglobosum LB1]GAM27851.1 hypothetical protein SAMD00019534_110270 [Acytostelium subglobosum LB1]|eukprot:XP_012749134.1 hypothetical protein SAMD00019534_110270 [Acytostelium subglobosum LB1]
MSARFVIAFKQIFVSEVPPVMQGARTIPSNASRVIEFFNPFTNDPTSKFINYAAMFATFYGLKCALEPHHDHQDVIYPYMKTKRTKTLAHLFNKTE